MATEQTSTVATRSGSLAKWASWLAALVGLWVIASPFVLSGPFATGTPMWSNVVAGVLIALLAAFGAYAVRTSAEAAANRPAEWSGWVAALVGVWVAVAPFVLSGSIGSATPTWSNVAAGAVALVLAAYAGYSLHSGG